MLGQMTIFDFLSDPDDPIRNAIKHMRPYWTSSKEAIVKAYKDNKAFLKTVKNEYCPYGYCGHFGGDFGKKGVFTLTGWEIRNGRIKFIYDPYRIEGMTWTEFANCIADLIRTGEFLEVNNGN